MGDILFDCSGGTPGSSFNGNLTFFLTVNVTNKLLANNTVDVPLTVDLGAGPVPANVPAQLFSPNAIVFNGLNFTVPPSGKVGLRLTNLRGDAHQLGQPELPILVYATFNPGNNVALGSDPFTVAVAEPGLLTQSSSSGVRCQGSPLPSVITLANLLDRGTAFFTTRVTEGFAAAFQTKDAFSDTGTRIMVRYSGFPAAARLFVPDFVAGSDAVQPTAGGDLGLTASGGQYAPSATGTLLLMRVMGADQNGAGGTLSLPVPGAGVTSFGSVSEVPLTNGAGNVVYEVVDANQAVRESAQIPTFVGVPPSSGGNSIVANARVSFAPLSTVNVASSAPIPRFADVMPQSDCDNLGDCNAAYFPKLVIDSPALNYTAQAITGSDLKYVRVLNHGGGLMHWTATVIYQDGSGWLLVSPQSGVNNATLYVGAFPKTLSPGVYHATITIDAGPYVGSQTLYVTLTATGGTSSAAPVIGSVDNAASLLPGPLVAGSLAAIRGSNFSGSTVAVTFNNIPAKLIHSRSARIDAQVPAELAQESSAVLKVTVDGQSASQKVALVPVAPAIFAGGIQNRDNTWNSASNPAAMGSAIRIFATGLASPGSGPITARVQGRDVLAPDYAGAAADSPGVQQVNLTIPADLVGTTVNVEVCGNGVDPKQRVCSAAVGVAVK